MEKNSAENEDAGQEIKKSCVGREALPRSSSLLNSNSWLSWRGHSFSLFGERTFEKVVKVKWGQMGGP